MRWVSPEIEIAPAGRPLVPPMAAATQVSPVSISSDLASPEIGRYLAEVLVDRICDILGHEFPQHPAAGRGDASGEVTAHGG